MDTEKIKDKAQLTANGVGALAVGAPLFLADGLAHLGVGGMVVAAACTFFAARHTEHMVSGVGGIVKKLVAIPERQESEAGDGRTFGEKLTGRHANPKKNVTQPREQVKVPDGSILVGTDARGKQVYRTLKELKSILILGLAEGGKSTTASWIVAQCIRDGASIVVIDRHGRSSESLTARLSPFESFFACQPARLPKDALNNALFVKNELDSRIDGESPCDTPLVLVIDEFSEIMKQVALGRGEWLETGEELTSLIEEINTQGRKYKVFVVAIGQIANASRSGGTEIRDLFHTRMLHGMRESQAAMLLPKEYRQQASRLEKGQIILDMEGKNEPFMVQIPLLTEKEMRAIASQCQDRMLKHLEEDEDVLYEDEEADDDDPVLTPQTKLIKIGTDATTKRDVAITKEQFDMLIAMRKNGLLKGYRTIMRIMPVTEAHARNLNKLLLAELGEVVGDED